MTASHGSVTIIKFTLQTHCRILGGDRHFSICLNQPSSFICQDMCLSVAWGGGNNLILFAPLVCLQIVSIIINTIYI